MVRTIVVLSRRGSRCNIQRYSGTSGTSLSKAFPINAISALHYYCANHSGMGNKVNLIEPMRVEMSESLAKVATFLRTFTMLIA